MNKVTGRDKVFYLDQQTDRECRLSEKVDDVFEINQEIARIHAVKQFQRDREEERYMMEIHFHKMTLIVLHHLFKKL